MVSTIATATLLCNQFEGSKVPGCVHADLRDLIEHFVCEEQPRRTRAEIHTTSILTLQLAIMVQKNILAPGTQPIGEDPK